MDQEKAALYGAVIALGVFGILLLLACVLCKYCLTSKKAQRWSGLDKILGSVDRTKTQDEPTYNKNITSHESEFMLKTQQGEYVGYDTLERDISIPKLPNLTEKRKQELNYQHLSIPNAMSTPSDDEKTTVSSSHSSHHQVSASVENEKMCVNLNGELLPQEKSKANTLPPSDTEEVADNVVDMTDLKSAVQLNDTKCNKQPPVPKTRTSRYNGGPAQTFHNNYTIFEETSDLSGNESGAKSQSCLTDHSDSDSQTSDEDSQSDSVSDVSLVPSDSPQQFGSSLDLLDHHIDDSGLGQVEYSLQYHREPSQLVLHIIQAQNLELPSNAAGQFPDTFIKTFASGCHNHDPKKQTKICKATANPIFKENFIFRITTNEFYTATITLQVFSRDQYARQKLVGEIFVALLPLCSTESYRTWSNILDYDHQPLGSCAEVQVGLEYCTSTEELKVLLSELRSLKLQSSPVYKTKEIFMTVTLFTESNHPKMKRRTTSHSLPTTSHSLFLGTKCIQFPHVHHSTMRESKLLIELCEGYPDRTQQTLGYTILGAGTTDTEYGHWLLVDSSASHADHIQQPVTMWHNIHVKPPRSKFKPPHFNLR